MLGSCTASDWSVLLRRLSAVGRDKPGFSEVAYKFFLHQMRMLAQSGHGGLRRSSQARKLESYADSHSQTQSN